MQVARRLAIGVKGVGGGVQNAWQPIEGEAVDDLLALALTGNEAAVPQASQVRTDPRLRLAHKRHELAYRSFPCLKELKISGAAV